MFYKMVRAKVPKSIDKKSITSILHVFFDEFLNDLKSGVEVKINNFGIFRKKNHPPRRHMNIWTKEIGMSKGRDFLQLALDGKVKTFLKEKIDHCKSFEGG